MDSLPIVELKPKGAQRLRFGHVWVYKSDIRDVAAAKAGDIVQLVVRHGSGGLNPLGIAFFNPASLISLRLISKAFEIPDIDFWRNRLQQAADLRHRLCGPDTAYRLVFSEADTIPGLIVDRYHDVLVMQMLCAGTERLRPMWLELLSSMFKPRAIIERDDTNSRSLEGLTEQKGILSGSLDGPVQVQEGGLQLLVDPLEGQKTGSFLDQRENRQRVAAYAQGRCLDVFSYQGGFGLQLLKGGAEEVTLVDQSRRALEAGRSAAKLNGLDAKLKIQEANAFDHLRKLQQESERYDVIVLDPPAFAKNHASVQSAIRGYKDINLRAMHLLIPGGILVSCSCSYHMTPERFEQVLTEAARDAGRTVQVLERRSQSRDHPERLGFPESHYLKCLVLRVL